MSESNEIYKVAAEAVEGKTVSANLGTPTYIPLRNAYLCGNCEVVGNSQSQCPACSSPHLMPLTTRIEPVLD